MVYVTGDIHADFKLLKKRLSKIKKNDYLIICGDFGFIWDNSELEQKILKTLGRYNILFVDGANENFDLLKEYAVTEWNGGKVQVISGNLIHLMRGQVFDLQGVKIFTFGGGESTYGYFENEGNKWKSLELPSKAEMVEGVENLNKCDYKVDYIITHDAPQSICNSIFKNPTYNHLHTYLDQVAKSCKFRRWYSGCYHKNKKVTSIHSLVFDQIIPLEGTEDVSKKKRK